MGLIDTSVVVPRRGYILTRSVSATPTVPTAANLDSFAANTTTPFGGYTNFGHTQRETPLEFGQEGGGSEVLGTWQNESLLEEIEATSDYLLLRSVQLRDPNVLKLYHGGGTVGAGFYDVPDTPAAQELDTLVVVLDARGPLGLWIPKASVRREDAMSWDPKAMVGIPLRFTFLKNGSQPKIRWISDAFTV